MTKICSCCGNLFVIYGTHIYKTRKNGKHNINAAIVVIEKKAETQDYTIKVLNQ